jgi:tetratricopeptide (TPR) repeat protein
MNKSERARERGRERKCDWITILFLSLAPTLAFADLTQGVAAFEARKWPEAMNAFFEVLREDPGNTDAHAYVTLIAREMETERLAILRAHRLEMLGDAARRVDASRQDPTLLTQAVIDTTHAEQRAKEEKWHSRCEEARMERQAGHLLSANAIVLQVIAENDGFAEAQKELSELQSQIRKTLDSGTSTSIMERYALEGFYAYGQADYAASLNAWGKLRTLLEQSYAGAEGLKRLSEYRFLPYETIAKNHVDEETRIATLKTLFEDGVTLYEQKHFASALEEFRKVAIRDPEYPQLGYYLVQAEAGSEQERAERLGEEKRQAIERALQQGLAALDQEKFQEAEHHFHEVLRLDPSHPQARSYLAMAEAEMQKRHDPKAAQMHYEAGLIAYASGKLDEALREWHIAIRMNPRHEKALNALAKVQKELALNRRSDMTDETLP